MNYSKLMESSRPFSAYEALSGGVNAWGLGGMGLVKRGGFGSAGGLGSAGVPPPPVGFAYLIGADGAYLKGADGAYLLGAA